MADAKPASGSASASGQRFPALGNSIAARLVLGYGLLAIFTMLAISTVFYAGTVGVIDHNIDSDLRNQGTRLAARLQSESATQLAAEVSRQLHDGIDSDREIYLVSDAHGKLLAGNLAAWPAAATVFGDILTADVIRNDVATQARLIAYKLPDGGRFLMGDDLRELVALQAMVWRALAAGALLSLGLTLIGAALFRQQIARRIGDVRRTARSIAAGDLSQRIPSVGQDEFGLLNEDINFMLDRIEHLMNSVRDVSNAIAHDLRTPLTRIRTKLEGANRRAASVEAFRGASNEAIADIDELIRLFECLLQIAEAEAGVGTTGFERFDLAEVARDMADMYEGTAEERGMLLTMNDSDATWVHGDRNLVATAIASLIENAIKYGGDGPESGSGGAIDLAVSRSVGGAALSVRDHGGGIAVEELPKVRERFYRVDKSRAVPGNGLGLSIVSAIVRLHGGALHLENATPGLRATITLPAQAAAAPATPAA